MAGENPAKIILIKTRHDNAKVIISNQFSFFKCKTVWKMKNINPGRELAAMRKKKKLVCMCGKEFTGIGRAKYCSEACKQKAKRERKKDNKKP